MKFLATQHSLIETTVLGHPRQNFNQIVVFLKGVTPTGLFPSCLDRHSRHLEVYTPSGCEADVNYPPAPSAATSNTFNVEWQG